MLWLAVHLPCLSIDLASRALPEPTSVPLVISEGPVQRRRVQAVNEPARALGIQIGMGLSAAQALCADLLVQARQPDAEQQALQHLAACLYRVSAEVSLSGHPSAGNQGVLLEAWASRRLFGGGQQILEQVRSILAELGFQAQIGLAPTPAGAELAARLGDGVHALSRHALLRLLERAPLGLSDLSPDAQALLNGSGSRDLGTVLKLPRDALARRITTADLNYLDRLSGQCADRRPLYQPPARFEQRLELPALLSSTEQMRFPIRRLLGDLAAFLLGRDAGVQRFHLRFAHEDAPASQLQIGLLQVERDRQVLFELVEERLQRFELPAAVHEISLHAHELHHFAADQSDLLSDTRNVQDSPERLLERLRARLGEQAIQALEPQADYRPEHAQRLRPASTNRRADTALPAALGKRPSWLLATPQPIAAEALHLLSGPERIESGWWDGFDCRRDYYIAEDPHLRQVWVFKTPGPSGGWFIHGVFG